MKKKVKKCNVCNLTKSVSEFNTRKKKKFVVSEGIYKTYVFPSSPCKDCLKISALNEDGSPNWYGVLTNIKKKCKKNDIYYDLTLEEFKIWLSGQNDECHYCKISLKDYLIYVAKDVPGFQFKSRRFEIDRRNNDPSIGYRLDNICLACRVCNVKKGSEFSYEEFVEYARKYITPENKKIIF